MASSGKHSSLLQKSGDYRKSFMALDRAKVSMVFYTTMSYFGTENIFVKVRERGGGGERSVMCC